MRIIACICLAALLAACAAAEDAPVRPGDVLGVNVLGEPDLTGRLTVRDDGAIALPLVGTLTVAGSTPGAVAALLTERLAEYIKHPQVTVQLLERAPLKLVVSGAVKSPGVYFAPADTRLAEALALAGGASADADLSRVNLARAGASQVVDLRYFLEQGDATQNPVLSTGDSIGVARREFASDSVRVIGKVARPGAYPAGSAITPWDLIAEAGGLAPGANPREAVLRPAAGEPQVIDLAALLEPAAGAEAPVLKAGDTLVVPGLTAQVYVLGGVVRPGPYYMRDGTRLLEAIAEAGGMTEFALLEQAYIVRAPTDKAPQAAREPVDLRRLLVGGDMSYNLELRAGDALFIPVRSPAGRKPPLLERAASLLGPLIYLLF